MEQYKTIEPGIWKPQNEGDSITGILVSKEEDNPERNMSAKYMIDSNEGVTLVWGSAVLDERMAVVPIQSKVRITYNGKKELKKGKMLTIFT